MWRKKILPYFQYTKKERAGILTLLVIVSLLWVIPYFFSDASTVTDKTELKIIDAAIDSLQDRHKELRNKEPGDSGNFPIITGTDVREKTFSGFPFDPNITSSEEWEKLGINPKTIRIIQNYRQKGGRFRKAEDLQKVYGFKHTDFIRLKSFVRINTIKSEYHHSADPGALHSKKNADSSADRDYPKANLPSGIDINEAAAEKWEQFPGIGQKLAARIVLFREKLGGFHTVEQVGETFGISPELFLQIKPDLVVSANFQVRKININGAAQEDLKQHPYIGQKLATLIISYREQHGNFIKTDDLQQIPLINTHIWQKMAPYLIIDQN